MTRLSKVARRRAARRRFSPSGSPRAARTMTTTGRRWQGGRVDQDRLGAAGQVRPHAEPDDPGLPGAAARLHAAQHLQARPGKRGRRGHPRARRGPARGLATAARPTSSSCDRDSSTATARPIKASDFENTIKRLVVSGGPFSSFVTPIVGTDKLKSCEDDLEGIVTDDKTGDITITLSQADTKFPFALAETWTAPTPAAKSPCKGQENPPPPGYGPYTWKIQNPSRQFTLTKNPDFDLPGIPAGQGRQDDGDQVQRLEDDPGRDQRRARLHDRGSDGRPAAAGTAEVPGPHLARAEPAEHLLLLPERHDAAVRQARGAAGRELRHRQPGAPARSSAAGSSPAARSSRRT